jgi:site-specific recombinase XerC
MPTGYQTSGFLHFHEKCGRTHYRPINDTRRINRESDNTGSVGIWRKGGKEATIPLNYKACQALAAWLKVRPKVDHGSIFVTKFHTPMSKRAILRWTGLSRHGSALS